MSRPEAARLILTWLAAEPSLYGSWTGHEWSAIWDALLAEAAADV